ncbi:hypothetical protein NX862_01985 [Rhodobacter sp. KR11]|uniref:hypothetical protein n=1 Tax=Rhodobacter sp. KR11 TaxID=2974588 RepID=UPI00222375D4|nr:hypothetical protein [Rhodobacter sp. KR11]MCW1917515.1 hypothetical protein [Rhodobacter sp. KR11]
MRRPGLGRPDLHQPDAKIVARPNLDQPGPSPVVARWLMFRKDAMKPSPPTFAAPSLAAKFNRRRALMAKDSGQLAFVPFDVEIPALGGEVPASLGQFLAVERSRERRRNAEKRASQAHNPLPIRIG